MAGIFVSGGCVTRDTYEQLKHDHHLTGYIARQSLISAASGPTVLAREPVGTGFEVRAVMGDLKASMHSQLAQAAPQTDLLVLDLLVERFGVLALPDGSYVTRTPGLRKTEAIGQHFEESEHIAFGTPRHFRLWVEAALEYVDHLREVDLLRKVVLVETPWTDSTLAGGPVQRYLGWDPGEVARKYAPYYELLRGLGMRAIRIPDELVVSDDDHKWGASPFHYAPATHDWLADQMLAFLS